MLYCVPSISYLPKKRTLMSNKTIYRITLTPLSPFFFGGENTFGDDNRNYLVKSNYFPQQTALLGLLRYQLLVQNGLLSDVNGNVVDIEKAQKLIGECSFAPTPDNTHNQFGVIENISPIFLLRQDTTTQKETTYWTAPFNEGYNSKSKYSDAWHLHIEPNNSCLSARNSQQKTMAKPLCVLKRMDKDGKEEVYLAKNELETYLLGSDNSTKCYEDVFKSVEKIGINRPLSHKPHTSHLSTPNVAEESGFYKQTSYNLEQGFSFAFYATLTDDTKLHNNVVYLGAERSAFMMNVHKVDDIPKNYDYASKISGSVKSNEAVVQIVFISDTYVEADIYNYCQFAITQIVPFRFLQARLSKTRHYFDVSDEKIVAMQKSKKFQLLKRGSILFVRKSDIENATNLIKKYQDFTQIGYNQFIIF